MHKSDDLMGTKYNSKNNKKDQTDDRSNFIFNLSLFYVFITFYDLLFHDYTIRARMIYYYILVVPPNII